MRRRMAVFASGLMLLLPQGAPVITLDEFEAAYRKFRAGSLGAGEFLRLCNEALAQLAEQGALPEADNLELEEAARTVRSFQFQALMKMGNYYAASLIAGLMKDRFGDRQRHHEMLLSICTRRDDLEQGLKHARALIDLARQTGLDPDEYLAARDRLEERRLLARDFTPAGLWLEVSRNGPTSARRYAGRPLLVRGQGSFRVSENKSCCYIVFDVHGDGRKWISCQMAMNEVPFLQGVTIPGPLKVTGAFISASNSLVLLQPSHYLGTA